MGLFYNNYQKLRQENIDNSLELSDANYAMLDRIIQYISAHNISLFELEVVKKDLIGLAAQAEKNQGSLEDMLGVPEREFCNTLMEGAMKKNHFEHFLLSLKDMAVIICIFHLTFFIADGCPKNYGLTWSVLSYGIIIAFLQDFIQHTLQKRIIYNRHAKKWKGLIYTVFFLLLLVWLILPLDSFVIHGNGWGITLTVVAVTAVFFFGNNLYWDLQSRKYHWE